MLQRRGFLGRFLGMLAAPLMLSTAPKLQAAVVGSVGTCVDLEPMAMAEEVILTAIPRVNGDHIEVDIISHPASTTRVWSANHLLRGKLYPLMDGRAYVSAFLVCPKTPNRPFVVPVIDGALRLPMLPCVLKPGA